MFIKFRVCNKKYIVRIVSAMISLSLMLFPTSGFAANNSIVRIEAPITDSLFHNKVGDSIMENAQNRAVLTVLMAMDLCNNLDNDFSRLATFLGWPSYVGLNDDSWLTVILQEEKYIYSMLFETRTGYADYVRYDAHDYGSYSSLDISALSGKPTGSTVIQIDTSKWREDDIIRMLKTKDRYEKNSITDIVDAYTKVSSLFNQNIN